VAGQPVCSGYKGETVMSCLNPAQALKIQPVFLHITGGAVQDNLQQSIQSCPYTVNLPTYRQRSCEIISPCTQFFFEYQSPIVFGGEQFHVARIRLFNCKLYSTRYPSLSCRQYGAGLDGCNGTVKKERKALLVNEISGIFQNHLKGFSV
jgi:hypothetical protein